MSNLIRLDLLLTRLSGGIAGFAVIAMMLVVAFDAFTRQMFNMRIPFVSVIVANYFMVAIAFLPLALAEAQDRHISVDLIFGRLPASAQRIVAVVVHALAGLTCAGLTWTMSGEAMRRYISGSIAVEDGVSMAVWPGYFLLPIGFGLLGLTHVLRVVLGLFDAEEARAPLIADTNETQMEAEQ